MRKTALVLAWMALVVLLASGVAFAATVASQIGTAAVPGTTIVVNSKGDGAKTGNCTLREAIEAADTNAAVDGCEAGSATERDAIHFSIGEEATIVLGSELPTITDATGLNINGQRKAKITVSGNDSVRVLRVGEGALTIANLTVAHGSADDFGGGINNFSGTLRVINSTFSGNSADDFGGGIYNFEDTLEVTNSTFSGNSARLGGGIFNHFGTLEVTNSTFSENSAEEQGGGIYNNVGPATLRNTIVANSTSGGPCYDNVPITDSGYNIEDGNSCSFSEANNSMTSTEPKLADALANNGGPTKTIALKKGSPAINAIPKATNGCGTEVKTDQRGVARPQAKKCDVGAFEKKVRRR